MDVKWFTYAQSPLWVRAEAVGVGRQLLQVEFLEQVVLHC